MIGFLAGLGHPTFAAPERLLSLLVVPVFLCFSYLVRRRRSRTRSLFTNLPVLAGTVRSSRRRWSRHLPTLLLALALVSAALAIGRPTLRVRMGARGTTVVLLVDVSGSMEATDIRPERIYAAVSGMRELVEELPLNDKVGLVSFSDKVEVLDEPTTDHNAVISSLRLLGPEGGTALGEGVLSAVRVVLNSLRGNVTSSASGRELPAAIVLESDGAQDRGGLTPFQAGKIAGEAGIRIYGIALGTAHGVVIEGKGLLARVIPVPPDPGTVALLARESGGEAFDAASATAVNTIYRKLGDSISVEDATSEITPWFELAAAVFLVSSVLLAVLRGGALP